MKKILFGSLLCFAFSAGLSSCSGHATVESTQAKAPLISDSTLKLLTIDTARVRSVDGEVKLSGIVSFDENKVVKVYPFSSGQVQTVNVSLGDYVHKGQALATIKSADIAGNYADLSAAGNDLSIARRAMQNEESLFKNGIASEREYIEAKENYNKAAANVGKLQRQIQINGGGRTAASGAYTVAAPRSGFVVEKLINPGNFIRNDNSSNLFTIGDIGDVWIWANVFETDLAKVKRGSEAAITTLAYPDRHFIGTVDMVSELLDPTTKVMKVRIVLPNKEGLLKPEMFANITIANKDSKTAVALPSSAVISEYGKNYVVVYKNQNDVKVQEVSVLKNAGAYTFLSGGLNDGDRIITQNQILVYQKLKEGKG